MGHPDGGGTVTEPAHDPNRDEAERADQALWETERIKAQHAQLDNVRATAGKYQAIISAILGSFVTAGFVWGPEQLEKFPITGQARTAALAVVCAAGLAGLAAAVLSALAATGYPKVTDDAPGRFKQRVIKATNTSLKYLACAVRFAAVSALLILAVTSWTLFVAAGKSKAPPEPPTVLVQQAGHSVCGDLATDRMGTLHVIPKVAEGAVAVDPVPITAKDKVVIVDACPG